MEWENAELRDQLLGVTQERDSALRKSQGLQSKLESLEQVLKVRGLDGGGGGHRFLAQGESGAVEYALVEHWGLRPKPGAPRPFPLSSLSSLFNRGYLEPMVSEAPSS